jgi:hypothetical protein
LRPVVTAWGFTAEAGLSITKAGIAVIGEDTSLAEFTPTFESIDTGTTAVGIGFPSVDHAIVAGGRPT